jgi:uncharacterized protein YecT (DUF1311 family)
MKTSGWWKNIAIALSCLGIIGLGTAGLSAQNYPTSKNQVLKAVDCADAKTLIEAKECFIREYEEADKELNEVYQQVISGLEGESKQRLIRAEQAWIKYRDTNCDYRSGNWGGVQRVAFRYSCLARMTRDRTQELQLD